MKCFLHSVARRGLKQWRGAEVQKRRETDKFLIPRGSWFIPMQILPEHKAYWQQKQKQIAQETQQRTQQAYAVLDEIVAVLVHNYGANRVLLFGSLVRGKFGLESDIDLAVEGIAKQDFFAAMGKINLMTDFWVDLKPFEDLQPHFRERILEYGKWIYGEPIAK